MNTEKQTLKIELDLDSVHQAMKNITGHAIGDATVVMVQQRAKGIAKYGVTIEDSGLSAEELVRHAQEEVADASVYLAQAVRVLKRHDAEIKNGLDQSYSQGVVEGIRILFNAFDSYLTKHNPSDVRDVFVYLRSYCQKSGVPVDSPTPGVSALRIGTASRDELRSMEDIDPAETSAAPYDQFITGPTITKSATVEVQNLHFHEPSFNAGITYADRKWRESVEKCYLAQGHNMQIAEVGIKACAPQLSTPHSYVMWWGPSGANDMRTGAFDPSGTALLQGSQVTPEHAPLLVIPL